MVLSQSKLTEILSKQTNTLSKWIMVHVSRIMMKYSYIIGNCVITSKIDGDSVKMDNDIVQMIAFSLSICHASYICLKCSNMPHSHVANMLNISNIPNVWTRLLSTNVFCSWFHFNEHFGEKVI